MNTPKPLTSAEEQAFIRLIGIFDWDISSLADKQQRDAFLEDYNLSALIGSYIDHENLLTSEELTQVLREECQQEMDLLKLRIVVVATLFFVPYVYQHYQPEDITFEIRRALEISLEALDWQIATYKLQSEPEENIGYGNPEETEQDRKRRMNMQTTVLTVKQMINNLSASYDALNNHYTFSRILYSPDENYSRLHEIHILNRVFQMYCAEHKNCLDVILEEQHILLLKSVLYKEILKPDLSGITSPVLDYIELMARTIYVCTAREHMNKRESDRSLLDKLTNNLEQVGIDTYELDIIAENISDEYLHYYRTVRSGNRTLSEIPDTYIDEKIVEAALRISYNDFPIVPDTLRTKEMCRDAIACNPLFLEFVSPQSGDDSLYASAVCINGLALQFVPVESRTESICNRAIIQNGLAIKYLPDDMELTTELALSAVTNNYRAFYHIPDDRKNKEIVLTALRQFPVLYRELPEKFRELVDAALLAVSALPELSRYLPQSLIDNTGFMELAEAVRNGWQNYLPENRMEEVMEPEMKGR